MEEQKLLIHIKLFIGIFFELGKDKAAKGDGRAPPFIGCAQDTVGLLLPLPLWLSGYGKPLLFRALISLEHYRKSGLQSYINLIMPQSNTKYITKLRISSHHLQIESGRYTKSKLENPQKLTQISSSSYPRHLVGKRTEQKDTIIDITSDRQVKSNFSYRKSTASLTFNNYFFLFLYLYIIRITINNIVPHLKSPKNQNIKDHKL